MSATKGKGAKQALSRSTTPTDGQAVGDLDFIIEAAAGSLKTLVSRIKPKSIKEQIKKALEYAHGKSDLVQAIVETQVDFYSSGFAIAIAMPRNSSQDSFKSRFTDLINEHELEKVSEELIFDLAACNNAILHWKLSDSGKLEYVMTLAPDRCDFDNSIGTDLLKIDLNEEVVERIKRAQRDSDQKAEIEKTFPKKYIEAALKGKPVELRNEDNEYWVACSWARKFNGLAAPSMASVFGDVQLRELLISGDWSVAFFIKNLVHLIKQGESITNGPQAGSRKNWASKTSIKKLMKLFQNPSQLLRIFGDHTLNIEYKYPDPEIFTPAKYQKVEERILRWGNVIDVIMTGQGDGFAQGSIGKNRFEARGRRIRKYVGWMFRKFLLDERIARLLKVPEKSEVRITWNNQNLKDWKEVMEGLEQMYDRGVLDVETFLERMGESFETIKARKQSEKKDKDLWQPLFEKSQGLLDKKDGRPPDDGKAKSKPAPKPSRTKASKGDA
ncbi:MAG: hypothetical protein KIS92_02760 [Planctomycetota bacterium]|nr:hypothetical protein [Planctomycetota bacterium]